MDIEKERRKAFWCYEYELSTYKRDFPNYKDIKERWYMYREQECNYTWLDIIINEVYVGFIILSDDCHPECDQYICETYIKPAYRRRGIAKETIVSYFGVFPGKYCMYIQKLNKGAKNFWKSVAEEYSTIPLKKKHDEYDNDPQCTQYIITTGEGISNDKVCNL